MNNKHKPRLVISSGAGISAESGIRTFRDSNGLWEEYPVMQVASVDGFTADPTLVHQFYNQRRRDLLSAQPNEAHKIIARLEKDYDVYVITQNVDDLHERAGSTKVLHLHGELMKIRAIEDPTYVETLTPPYIETSPATLGRNGMHMRPHIVFFGEAVPNIEIAMQWASEADIFVVIGTSLQVYPAAGLMQCVRPGIPVYYIDPNPASVSPEVTVISATASSGLRQLAQNIED